MSTAEIAPVRPTGSPRGGGPVVPAQRDLPPDVPLEIVLGPPPSATRTGNLILWDLELLVPDTPVAVAHREALRSVLGADASRGVLPAVGDRPDSEDARRVLLAAGIPSAQVVDLLPRYLPALARARAARPRRSPEPVRSPDSLAVGMGLPDGPRATHAVISGSHPAHLSDRLRTAGITDRLLPDASGSGIDGARWCDVLDAARRRAGAHTGLAFPVERVQVITRRPLLYAAALDLGMRPRDPVRPRGWPDAGGHEVAVPTVIERSARCGGNEAT